MMRKKDQSEAPRFRRGRVRPSFLGLLAVGLCLALMSSGATIVSGQLPASAAGCFGGSCHGEWPDVQGCTADALQMHGYGIDWQYGDDQGGQKMKGTALVYYSPKCRAGFAEFVMSYLNHPTEFIPQLWVQPQHGGRKTLPQTSNGEFGWKVRDGKLDEQSEEFLSVLVDWNDSIRACYHDQPDDWDLDPDLPYQPVTVRSHCGDDGGQWN